MNDADNEFWTKMSNADALCDEYVQMRAEIERLHRILRDIWDHGEDKVLAPNLTYSKWLADLAEDAGGSLSPNDNLSRGPEGDFGLKR